MKMKLFPATPEKPTIAFCFSLLDYLESLLLECQVSVSDFVAAVTFLSAEPFIDVSLIRDMYIIIKHACTFMINRKKGHYIQYLSIALKNTGF